MINDGYGKVVSKQSSQDWYDNWPYSQEDAAELATVNLEQEYISAQKSLLKAKKLLAVKEKELAKAEEALRSHYKSIGLNVDV
jgi:hypothetical protein